MKRLTVPFRTPSVTGVVRRAISTKETNVSYPAYQAQRKQTARTIRAAVPAQNPHSW